MDLVRVLHTGIHSGVLLMLLACGGGGGSGQPPSSPGTGSANHFNETGGFNGQVRAVVPVGDATGEVYVAGDFTAHGDQPVARVVRLRPDGSVNQSFSLASAIGQRVTALAVADDGTGDLYVAEDLTAPAVPGTAMRTARVWRVNADGTVDQTFTSEVFTDLSDVTPSAILPDPDFSAVIVHLIPAGDGSGRLYVAGGFDQFRGSPVGPVVRLTPNGTLDPTFNYQPLSDGVFRVVPALDGTGSVYVATFARDSPSRWLSRYLLRLTPTGAPDPGFDTAAFVWPDARVHLIVPVDDGSGDVFAIGSFLNFAEPIPGGPNALRSLVRINPDGSIDRTSARPQIDGSVVALAKAAAGTQEWLAARLLDIGRFDVLRFLSDGAPDPSFTTGQVVGTAVNVLVSAPDGSGDFYVAGALSTYNGVEVKNIARVNGDGNV